jgi:hypothetical protein
VVRERWPSGQITFSRLAEFARPALVNGAPGIVLWLPGGQPLAVMGFSVTRGKIVEIDVARRPRVPSEAQPDGSSTTDVTLATAWSQLRRWEQAAGS